MTTHRDLPQFQMGAADKRRLEHLPWHLPLEEWAGQGAILLSIRRGESRHPVIFIESDDVRYAIKETTPHMAQREIHSLREIEFRGIPALSPVGTVIVSAPPLRLESAEISGPLQYISGDRGYTVTRLAARVMPHSLLFRLAIQQENQASPVGRCSGTVGRIARTWHILGRPIAGKHPRTHRWPAHYGHNGRRGNGRDFSGANKQRTARTGFGPVP